MSDNPALCSLVVTGLIADDIVNADCIEDVGIEVFQTVVQYLFKKVHVIPLIYMCNTVKLNNDAICIDLKLLFQRLVIVSSRNDNLADVYRHEMCSYPSALFENRTTQTLPNKAAQVDALRKNDDVWRVFSMRKSV